MSSYIDYVTDENDNYILNENGNKIEYTVEYHPVDDWVKPKQPIHVNNDGHLDTQRIAI